jgi:MFS family permease
VWGYSIQRAGLVVSVGPLVVAGTAPLFGRLAGRIGQRALLIPGGLIWASGGLLLLLTATTTPHYLSQYLPAILLTGLGVSLCLPQLASASVQGLPPDSFGSGSAINQAIRNLAATLGVALVVAFTGKLTPETALDRFHHVWWLLSCSGACVSLLSVFLPRRPPAAGKPPVQAIAAH